MEKVVFNGMIFLPYFTDIYISVIGKKTKMWIENVEEYF